MKNSMKLIMERFNRKMKLHELMKDPLWEGNGGVNDDWNKAHDSDFGIGMWNDLEAGGKKGDFELIILDRKDLNEPYQTRDGMNHGLVSHAIKHAIEMGIDLSPYMTKFQAEVSKRIEDNKCVYVRVLRDQEDYTVCVTKDLIQSMREYKSLNKKDPKRKELRAKLQKLLRYGNPKAGVEFPEGFNFNPKLMDLGSYIRKEFISEFNKNLVIAQNIVNTVTNLKEIHLLTVFDFYYDLGRLDELPFFDTNFIIQYRDKTLKILDDNRDKLVPSDRGDGGSVLKIPGSEYGIEGMILIALRKDGAIKTAHVRQG